MNLTDKQNALICNAPKVNFVMFYLSKGLKIMKTTARTANCHQKIKKLKKKVNDAHQLLEFISAECTIQKKKKLVQRLIEMWRDDQGNEY
jgi:hypothetical protein